jgi:TusA-related sulfurtransferase
MADGDRARQIGDDVKAAPAPPRLDVRGLPSPEPLVRSLEAAEELGGGASLVIVTERKPTHLVPMLVERGFEIDAVKLADRYETLVRRRIYG